MKNYSFHDTFVKTCEFKNGQGDCKKTRESKKCIDDHCEIVKIPMKKKEILNSYYQTQQGGSPQNTFKCPYCDLVLPVKDLTTHIKSHTNVDSSKLFQQKFNNVKPINKSFDELFPQFGGCDTCMVGGSRGSRMIGSRMIGGGLHKNKYICPICHEHHYISHMKHHYLKFHQ
jgi:hypothetical protein